LAGAVLVLALQRGLWPVAMALVAVVELWPVRSAQRGARWVALRNHLPQLMVGMSVALIIAVAPREATQVVAAGLYALWRTWWTRQGEDTKHDLLNLLAVQGAVYEALFLLAAAWRTSEWLILALVWGSSYITVFGVLEKRGERVAGLMAATWALIAAEISWVLLTWLFVYTIYGGYLLVPQPALVLSALGYCFGNIYATQRAGKLSRGRLTEYLLIGLILIAVVITGTSWKGGTL
jgi:hypothetical protein